MNHDANDKPIRIGDRMVLRGFVERVDENWVFIRPDRQPRGYEILPTVRGKVLIHEEDDKP